MRRKCILCGRKINRYDNVEPCENTRRKVNLQTRHSNVLQYGIVLAVEYRRDQICAEEHAQINHSRYKGLRCQRIAQDTLHILPVPCSVASAQDRLYSLRDPRIDGRDHKGQVRDHAVSRNSDIPRDPKDDRVEYDDDDPGRDLCDQRRKAAGEDPQRQMSGYPAFSQVELILPPDQIRGQHKDADHRRQPCGEHCSEDPHAKGEHEYVVKDYIGKTSGDHGCHRELGRPVISDKTQQQVVRHEHRRKQQDHPEIGPGHLIHCAVRSKKARQRPGAEESQQEKSSCDDSGQDSPVGEYLVCPLPIPLALYDRIFDSPAHSDHQAAAMDKAVDRDSQVQRCQPVRAERLRDEESIRKYVAGQRDHPKHIQ